MGLDAFVFCDCLEKGRLCNPPPSGTTVYVGPDGRRGIEVGTNLVEYGFERDQWLEHEACKHPAGILLHHRLGNIALIGILRAELNREAERFPILVTRVVYSGSHGGDFISIEMIPALQNEIESMAEFQCSSREAARFMENFRAQMLELAATALSVGKPIAF